MITARNKAMWYVALTYVGIVSAQAQLDPAMLNAAVAKLTVGQSLTQGASKLTLNQRSAGTEDAMGWFRATSTGGGFAVRFPAPINDVTYSTKTKDGTRLEQNILFSETATTRFMILCMKQDAFLMSSQVVDQTVGMIENRSHQFKSDRFTNGELSGLQYSGIDTAGLYFAGQTFAMGQDLCQFLVGSHEAFQGIPHDARAAFDSFRTVNGSKTTKAP
jgi:hypothetical protein